jgi:hypothetical protein
MDDNKQLTPTTSSDPFRVICASITRAPSANPPPPASTACPIVNLLEYYERYGYPKLPDNAGDQYLSDPDHSPCAKAAERQRRQKVCYISD